MKQLTEDYVSFEIAVLLKEKGFPQEKDYAIAMYDEDGLFCSLCTKDFWYYDFDDFDDKDCIAVTHQMAMRWLREEKGIIISICYGEFEISADGGNLIPEKSTIFPRVKVFGYIWAVNKVYEDLIDFGCGYVLNTYEDAVENALTLILEKLDSI